MKRLVSLLFFLLISLYSIQAQTRFKHPENWQAVLDEAKLHQKLIFLDAYTDWCGWCKVMDKKTFSDEAVGNTMNQFFINIKLEMEKDELGKKLALKYTVTGFPSYLIFNSDGELIYTTSGYSPPSAFMPELMKIINPENQLERPGYAAEFLNTEAYPEFYRKAMGMSEDGKRKKKKKKNDFPDSTEVNNWFHEHPNLKEETNWAAFSRFTFWMDKKNRDTFWQQYPELAKAYGHDITWKAGSALMFREIESLVPLNAPEKVEQLLLSKKAYIPDYENTRNFALLNYYKETGRWRETGIILDTLFHTLKDASPAWWNIQCWELYENCDDSVTLIRSLEWIRAAVEKEPEYASMDTYAALLYKTGRYEEAEEKALRAISIGKAAGEKVEETEKLLESIRNRMQPPETPEQEKR